MPPKKTNPQKQQVQQKTAELLALTDAFSAEYLDEEYRELCEKLIRKMSRKREVPFLRGRLSIWAAGVVQALGRINFLFDDNFEPYVSAATIADYFGAATSTVSGKASLIQDMFGLHPFDEEFTLPSLQERNPLRDLITVNGFITAISSLPPEIQALVRQNPDAEFIFEEYGPDSDEVEAQIKRVQQILGLKANQNMTRTLPLLKRYRKYLQTHLPWPFQVSGHPGFDPFSWENEYLDGLLSEKRRQEHQRLCRERPCQEDIFEVTGLSKDFELETGLVYQAQRLSDQKPFLLPVHAVLEEDVDFERTDPYASDYRAWFFNCGPDDDDE